MSVVDHHRVPTAPPLAPPDPEFVAQMARVDLHLARAREHLARARHLRAAEERMRSEHRRPRGLFIGFLS
jgi:hypothetical protein